jgi:drug/metabolite transporter (DMT)-like permease
VAIVFSVLCAVVYGASDFCGGLASRRTATLGVVFASQGVGFVLLLALMPWFGGTPLDGDWLWGAACGVAGAGALLLLYRGLAIGTMGIVSPVAALLAALVPIAYGVALRGERPSWLTIAGIAVALVAVVCVSVSPGAPAPADAPAPDVRRTFALPPGMPEAIGAGICFGLIFITLAQTRAAAGLTPLLVARLTTVVLVALLGIAGGNTRELRVARPALVAVGVCGALDVAANICYLLAVHSGLISIVAVISSLYPASTLALAAIVFGERLVRVQWAGVVLALAGVAAISAAH